MSASLAIFGVFSYKLRPSLLTGSAPSVAATGEDIVPTPLELYSLDVADFLARSDVQTPRPNASSEADASGADTTPALPSSAKEEYFKRLCTPEKEFRRTGINKASVAGEKGYADDDGTETAQDLQLHSVLADCKYSSSGGMV